MVQYGGDTHNNVTSRGAGGGDGLTATTGGPPKVQNRVPWQQAHRRNNSRCAAATLNASESEDDASADDTGSDDDSASDGEASDASEGSGGSDVGEGSGDTDTPRMES